MDLLYDTRLFYLKEPWKIESHAWLYQKCFGSFGIPYIGAPRDPGYELNPTQQVFPGAGNGLLRPRYLA